MSDPFPQTHTTTTTTVTVQSSPKIYFDVNYLKTVPGILKVVQIIVALITFICAVLSHGPTRPESILVSPTEYWPYRPGHAGWAAFVSFMAIILTLIWLCFHLFHVHDLAPRLPWLAFELTYYLIWTFFFFISGAVLAALAHDLPYWYGYHSIYGYTENIRRAAGVGAFFAFTAMILFIVSAVLILQVWKARRATDRMQANRA